MDTESLVTDTERELRILATALTDPHDGECLLCYVHRMLEFGCTGLRWAVRYRDLRAPRATAFEARLGRMGGYCDCEIFLNGYEPAHELWTPSREHEEDEEDEEDGVTYVDDVEWPEQLPACRGVRAGSTQGCTLWVRQRRGGWW
jgi:Protein of unknown function (DUF2695)